MGYTHYWKKTKKTGEKEWSEFKKFAANLVAKVNSGMEIENSAGDGMGTAVIRNGQGVGEPIITDDLVSLNGDREHGLNHETFYVGKSQTDGYNLCKTARKPYDPVVVACLIEAERLGIIDEWSSDGDDEEHEGGVSLHRSHSQELA